LKKTTSRFIITLVSIGLVLWLVVADLGNTNPGEISAVHANIRTFLGGPDCGECHGEKAADMPDACLACHEDVSTDISSKAGLHGGLESPSPRECTKCHSDHHGEAFALVSDLSFRLAGIEDIEQFDHSHLEFELEGKHLEIDCNACHELADIATLPQGQKRYMGLTQICASCHDDPHDGQMEADCASCHGQKEAFDQVAAFEHDARFPLDGVHDQISCKECHPKGASFSVESMAGANPPAWRECVDCHESPHAEEFLAGSYTSLPPEQQDCNACHLLDHEDFHAAVAHFTKEEHSASGFPLSAPHDDLQCQQCHQGDDPSFRSRFPGRSADDCASCHLDPHAEQFIDHPLAQDSCLSCHDRLQFEPAAFDVARHSQTSFPLTGAHQQSECAACHIDADPSDDVGPTYAAVGNRCQSCHQDAHDACFEPFAATNSVNDLDCDQCHSSTDFSAIIEPGFDHAAWTAFKLEGKHASTDCGSCHQPLQATDINGRSFGRAPKLLHKEIDSCEYCHEDIHHQSFDRPDLPAEFNGRQSCARCHGQDSFLPLKQEPFDHTLWTKHELRGAHAEAQCLSCHTQGPRGLVLGKDCRDCHDDPHDRRFDGLNLPASVNGKTDCARCHNEESFSDMRGAPFDHQAWTGFPLVDSHRFADCASCHGRSDVTPGHNSTQANDSTPAGQQARSLGKVSDHFAGSPDRCVTCHSNPHGQSFDTPQVPRVLNGEQGCARCHGQVSFRVAERDFNHDGLTIFPLDGSHSRVDCSECHRPLQRQGRDSRSFGRAEGTSCVDCHSDPHVGQFRQSKNSQCQDCHAAEGTFQSGLTFNHQTQSRYPLDGAHDDLDCSSCHLAYPLENGKSAVRYRPLGTECSDCHGLR
jgi:hypothetical protein